MSTNSGMTSIYIQTHPKRWRLTTSYSALQALERLSKIHDLGFAFGGIHPGASAKTSYVLHLVFSSQEEKDPSFAYFTKKVRRWSKRSTFTLLTD